MADEEASDQGSGDNRNGKAIRSDDRVARSRAVLQKDQEGGLALESFQTELGDMAPGLIRLLKLGFHYDLNTSTSEDAHNTNISTQACTTG